MAKTYTAAGTVVAGDVATAAAWNVIATDVNNLIVPPVLRVRRATLQSIPNNADTFFTFTIEDFDNDGCFTASSDTVTVQTTGVYYVSAGLSFASNATGYRSMYIMKNPSTVSDYASIFAGNQVTAASAGDPALVASSVQTFTAGDTIKVMVGQNSGGALNAGNVTLTSICHLSLAWVGRTA
jgi:hypothetical protein